MDEYSKKVRANEEQCEKLYSNIPLTFNFLYRITLAERTSTVSTLPRVLRENYATVKTNSQIINFLRHSIDLDRFLVIWFLILGIEWEFR